MGLYLGFSYVVVSGEGQEWDELCGEGTSHTFLCFYSALWFGNCWSSEQLCDLMLKLLDALLQFSNTLLQWFRGVSGQMSW